jgi:hypothetical protein
MPLRMEIGATDGQAMTACRPAICPPVVDREAAWSSEARMIRDTDRLADALRRLKGDATLEQWLSDIEVFSGGLVEFSTATASRILNGQTKTLDSIDSLDRAVVFAASAMGVAAMAHWRRNGRQAVTVESSNELVELGRAVLEELLSSDLVEENVRCGLRELRLRAETHTHSPALVPLLRTVVRQWSPRSESVPT